MTKPILVFCTVPDSGIADRISEALIQKKLAPCVSWGEPIQSVYRWQGSVEKATEWNLTIKTVSEKYSEVEKTILSIHPYDVPEIISVPILNGLGPYLKWMNDEIRLES